MIFKERNRERVGEGGKMSHEHNITERIKERVVSNEFEREKNSIETYEETKRA